ncbi:YqzE family protein [Paenibacillus chungangensis]|uniref:YqzE family protein n=1 Tax=Paenibacillus chungangensis TaxID=696535 RepID=A0ABW3HXA0_9BACL
MGDLVKYLTEQFVQFIETPHEQRKQAKASAKATKEPWLTRWFGWGPVGMLLWWKSKNHDEE